jgi:hypothetical protein
MSADLSLKPVIVEWVPGEPTPSYPVVGWAPWNWAISIRATGTIAASPTTCLVLTLDPTTWPTWNRFAIGMEAKTSASSPEYLASASALPVELLSALRSSSSKPEGPFLLPGVEYSIAGLRDPLTGKEMQGTGAEEVITLLEPIKRDDGRQGWRLVWQVKPSWFLRTERVQEFVETTDGKATDYWTVDTFSGPLAFVVKWAMGSKILAGFELWIAGLKKMAEGS